MKLIDADALRGAGIFEAVARGWCHETNSSKVMDPLLGEAIVQEVFVAIDAAPTVCCAECEYGPPPADAVGARTSCQHCYCGDNFERRQT